MNREIVKNYDITSSVQNRRLSHRDLLLENELRNVLALTNKPRRTDLSKCYSRKYGSNAAQRMIRGDTNESINYNECHEINKYTKHVNELKSSNGCADIGSRSPRSHCVFDNDNNFHEVDGFFVLDTRSTKDSKRENFWIGFLWRTFFK